MYTFSKLYQFPPKLKSKNEDIFTLFSPHVTNEETKHEEKLVSVHESRSDQPPQFSQDREGSQDGGLSAFALGKVPGKLGGIGHLRYRKKIGL